MDFYLYIKQQKQWSLKTFGNGKRIEGITKHIMTELQEIKHAENDDERLEEVIDVIILAMDLAWRLGFDEHQIEDCLFFKQKKNFARQWPSKEISEANQDKPTFHVKE